MTNLVALNFYLWLVKISLSCKKYNIRLAFFEIFKENAKFTVYSRFSISIKEINLPNFWFSGLLNYILIIVSMSAYWECVMNSLSWEINFFYWIPHFLHVGSAKWLWMKNSVSFPMWMLLGSEIWIFSISEGHIFRLIFI